MSIPALGVDKLMALHRIQARHRKLTGINNDMARETYLKTERRLDKQSTMIEIKTRRNRIPVERHLVDIRGYMFALRGREKTKLLECEQLGVQVDDLPYGVYDGATHKNLKPEIDYAILQNQPEKVRERRSKEMLREGKKTGRLIEQKKVLGKFDDIMNRRFDKKRGRLLRKHEDYLSSRGTNHLQLPPLPVDRSMVELSSRRSFARTGFNRAITQIPVASPGI